MAASKSQSPVLGPVTNVDESTLPQGNCRYIMTMPELKGHRCACVNFTLNRSLPGATCECGHLACYHNRAAEPPIDKQELDLLRQRIQQLEDLLTKGSDKENATVQRVSDLEGVVECRTEEMSQEIKKTYGNLNRAWHSIGELEKRKQDDELRFQGIDRHLGNVNIELQRLHERQCELNDADLNLEERLLDVMESIEDGSQDSPTVGRQRPQSSSNTARPSRSPAVVVLQRRSSTVTTPDRSTIPPALASPMTPLAATSVPLRSTTSAASELWTVHISLLPSSSLPFPFERQTNAYKRCLSRGLHQMVPVNGTSAEAFTSAVTRAFSSLLKNRPWMPLQAKLCDAATLQGLPMLRPLEPALVNAAYDVEFLRTHCAVLDVNGKIDSLYIAMQHSTFSWHYLRHSHVHLDGLEACWEYDTMLDANDPFEDDESVDEKDRPSAGDLVGSLPNLKRAASEISRSSSFGASMVESAERPPKLSRTPCPRSSNVPEVDRRQRIGTA